MWYIKRKTYKCKITRHITEIFPRIWKYLSISRPKTDDFLTFISIICTCSTHFSSLFKTKRKRGRIFFGIKKLSVYRKGEWDITFIFEFFEWFFWIKRLSCFLIPFKRASEWDDSKSVFQIRFYHIDILEATFIEFHRSRWRDTLIRFFLLDDWFFKGFYRDDFTDRIGDKKWWHKYSPRSSINWSERKRENDQKWEYFFHIYEIIVISSFFTIILSKITPIKTFSICFLII